jgi:hypothetical protein
MTRRLPIFLGLVGALALTSSAEAGRGHFSGGVHFGGGSHGWSGGSRGWSGGVHVSSGWHFSRPTWQPRAWNVTGHVYVGSYYYPRPYYYYYQPTYVPSYYSGSYYPVETTTAVAAPGVLAVAQPELPKFGMGLFAGGVQVADIKDSSDVGVLGRLRLTPGLLVEGELGKTSYENDLRVDRRLGASLVYEIGAYNKLAPYVLAGMGVQQAQVNGDYNTTQDFGEIGIGIRYAVTPHFHLTADVRAGSRATVSNDQGYTPVPDGTAGKIITPPTSESGDNEEYTRARLSAILYF